MKMDSPKDVEICWEFFAPRRRFARLPLQLGQHRTVTLVIDLALKVSGQQEAVMVNAEASVIETTVACAWCSSPRPACQARPLGCHDVVGDWAPFFDALRTMQARGVVRDAHLAIPAIHRDARTLLDAMGLGA